MSVTANAATPAGGAPARVLALCVDAEAACAGGPFAERVAAVRTRLDGPLRVAIAGRVKAGKSTLLNALVGERLAPTDAGECTRIVTWYQQGTGYDVAARLRSGERRPLPFRRLDGALDIELGSVAPHDVEAIDVNWPTSALARITLIDTPGLASLNEENSLRTRDFLDHAAGHPSDADAVIYVMKHLHRRDVEFLGSFMDRSVTGSSPINAVAVLSRADEIGAGRIDALDSADRIAARYRDDASVQALCATVIPLAGLLAETGLTLREDEYAALRTLAGTDATELDRMLLAADTFCDVSASSLTVELRRQLLDRFGMFGVRFATDQIRSGQVSTASGLAQLLVERSGLSDLRRLIDNHFLPRARVLQARSALVALRALAVDLRSSDPVTSDRIEREAERIEASATEFAQLRMAHLVLTGAVDVGEGERREIDGLMFASSAARAVGVPDGSTAETITNAALAGIDRWRGRGSDPLADPALVEVCETAARSYEALFVANAPAPA